MFIMAHNELPHAQILIGWLVLWNISVIFPKIKLNGIYPNYTNHSYYNLVDPYNHFNKILYIQFITIITENKFMTFR